MNEAILEEIVGKVFDKAKAECPVHSRNALCLYVSDCASLSYKTLERLYDKYISKKGRVGKQNEHTINTLCIYLNYASYADYVKKNEGIKLADGRRRKWKPVMSTSFVIGICCLLFLIYKQYGGEEYLKQSECMVWEKDHYEIAPCAPNSAKMVETLDPVRLSNFKKIEVNAATNFFNEETNKPAVWYHKNKNGEIEYYSAPGLHPIHGKTLNEITPYIIDKYVPIHNFKSSSFTD